MSKRKSQRDLVLSFLRGDAYFDFARREQELGRALTTEEVHSLYGRVTSQGQFIPARRSSHT